MIAANEQSRSDSIRHAKGHIWILAKENLSFQHHILDSSKQMRLLNITNSNGEGLFFHIGHTWRNNPHKLQGTRDIEHFNQSIHLPWILAGYFHAISHPEDKMGGVPPSPISMREFHSMIHSCELMDAGYQGPNFTWSSKRARGYVAARLDRVLYNQAWLPKCHSTKVSHGSRFKSDHCPLLVSAFMNLGKPKRLFQFDLDNTLRLSISSRKLLAERC